MKWIGVFLLPPGWDARPLPDHPPPPPPPPPAALNTQAPIYTPGWREALWEYNVNCLAQEHNAVTQASAWTQTAWSRVWCWPLGHHASWYCKQQWKQQQTSRTVPWSQSFLLPSNINDISWVSTLYVIKSLLNKKESSSLEHCTSWT